MAFAEPERPQTNRTVLGAMLLVLLLAVVLALWFLLFNGDDDGADVAADSGELPTALPLPTAAPVPTEAPTAVPTATVEPTPLPVGFEACAGGAAPLQSSTYLVDTNTAPLNHRSEPSASAELVGSFASGTGGLVFTGECLVNASDGYTWWQIDTDVGSVWVASDFLAPE